MALPLEHYSGPVLNMSGGCADVSLLDFAEQLRGYSPCRATYCNETDVMPVIPDEVPIFVVCTGRSQATRSSGVRTDHIWLAGAAWRCRRSWAARGWPGCGTTASRGVPSCLAPPCSRWPWSPARCALLETPFALPRWHWNIPLTWNFLHFVNGSSIVYLQQEPLSALLHWHTFPCLPREYTHSAMGLHTWRQVLYNMGTTQCEVALSSAAIPTPLVLQNTRAQLVATVRVHSRSGAAEVPCSSRLTIIHATPWLSWWKGCRPQQGTCLVLLQESDLSNAGSRRLFQGAQSPHRPPSTCAAPPAAPQGPCQQRPVLAPQGTPHQLRTPQVAV